MFIPQSCGQAYRLCHFLTTIAAGLLSDAGFRRFQAFHDFFGPFHFEREKVYRHIFPAESGGNHVSGAPGEIVLTAPIHVQLSDRGGVIEIRPEKRAFFEIFTLGHK
jgi:hypothetical protein